MKPLTLTETEARAAHEGRLSCLVRIVKPQPESQLYCRILDGTWGYEFTGDDWKCPMGTVGGELWVRETFGFVGHTFDENENITDWIPDRPSLEIHEKRFGYGYYSGHVIYAADGHFEWNAGDDPTIETCSMWKSSTTMPRWASRTTLRLESVAVKRVRDLMEEEAKGMGIDLSIFGDGPPDEDPAEVGYPSAEEIQRHYNSQHCRAFKRQFNAQHGPGSFESNYWVWVATVQKL